MLNGFGWSLYKYDKKIVRARMDFSPAIIGPPSLRVVYLDGPEISERIPLAQGILEKFEALGINENNNLETLVVNAQYVRIGDVNIRWKLLKVFLNSNSILRVELKHMDEPFENQTLELGKFLDSFNLLRSGAG